MPAAQYARKNKNWVKMLGKRGQVLLATQVSVAADEFAFAKPYSYVVAQIENQKIEMMGVAQEKLQPGDQVECVLRILTKKDATSIIEYGLKLKKIS